MLFSKDNVRAARLNSDQVAEMRQLYAQGVTQRALGEHYGLSTVQVGRIVRGESWKRSYALSVEEAKARIAPDPEGILQRALETQARVLGAQSTGQPPVCASSPLEGGDVPSETRSAEDILAEKLREYGVGS